MTGVRPLEAGDVPAIAALHRRVFGHGGSGNGEAPTVPDDDLTRFLDVILRDHPWRDPDLPSLVYEQDGEVIGCLGVMPRPMDFRGRRLRVAISHDFMVDPSARSTLAGLHLSRAAFRLPHDLLLADGNDASRAIWERSGGTTSLCHSLRWRRLLSPSRYMVPALANGGALGRACRPLLGGVDRLLRWRAPELFQLPDPEGSSEPLEVSSLLTCTEQVGNDRALRPVYDRRSLAWLLDRLERRKPPAELRRALVRGSDGAPLGWYLYVLRPAGIAEVVQVVSMDGGLGDVLDHLFVDAWKHGAIGVAGQADPLHLQDLGGAGCVLDGGQSWLLVCTDDPEVARAIDRGDVFLTRLECEGWIRLAHA